MFLTEGTRRSASKWTWVRRRRIGFGWWNHLHSLRLHAVASLVRPQPQKPSPHSRTHRRWLLQPQQRRR